MLGEFFLGVNRIILFVLTLLQTGCSFCFPVIFVMPSHVEVSVRLQRLSGRLLFYGSKISVVENIFHFSTVHLESVR